MVNVLSEKNIEFISQSGTIKGRLSGKLNNPRAGLICLHGGPGGDLHGNTNIFDEVAKVASELSFCTLQYSVFGASPSSGQPQDITIGTQIDDLLAAVSFFQHSFNCAFHLVGESAGATIVSQTWIKNAASFILLWPAFDLSDTDLGPYLTVEWRRKAKEIGYINDNGVILGSKMIETILTTDFSSAFELPKQPVFIAHGQKDVEVPYLQSIRAIKSAKNRLLFVSHPEAGHGFQETAQRQYLLDNLRTWFRSF